MQESSVFLDYELICPLGGGVTLAVEYETLSDPQFDGSEDRTVTASTRSGEVQFPGVNADSLYTYRMWVQGYSGDYRQVTAHTGTGFTTESVYPDSTASVVLLAGMGVDLVPCASGDDIAVTVHGEDGEQVGGGNPLECVRPYRLT